MYWQIQKTIRLSDIGSTQSVGLSDIGLRQNSYAGNESCHLNDSDTNHDLSWSNKIAKLSNAGSLSQFFFYHVGKVPVIGLYYPGLHTYI